MSGRPTTYTQELADVICERLSEGESLRAICAEDEMPDKATVFRWLTKYDDFATIYARARDVQAEVLADELVEIADDGSNDWMVRKFGDDERWVENGEALRRSQLRISTRQWIAERMLPKKYGTKVHNELTGRDGGPIETKETGYDLARKIAFALNGKSAG